MLPIVRNPLGSSIDSSEVHPENVPKLISVIPLGKFTDLSALQPENASSPILTTLSGSVILTMVLFPLKARSATAATGRPLWVAGTVISVTSLVTPTTV